MGQRHLNHIQLRVLLRGLLYDVCGCDVALGMTFSEQKDKEFLNAVDSTRYEKTVKFYDSSGDPNDGIQGFRGIPHATFQRYTVNL